MLIRYYHGFANFAFSCYVAIKLLPKALANAESNNEVSILEHVHQQSSGSKSGSEYIRRYLRHFTEHRAGKEYHGIVMQATGQSIQNRIVWHGISFAAAKTVAIGTIRGLRFLQEDCKVAHGGKVSLSYSRCSKY